MCNKAEQLIRKKFERSLYSYDAHAEAQKMIVRRLTGLIRNHVAEPSGIFEIGCGTGLLTQEIVQLFPEKELYVNDLNEKVEIILSQKQIPVHRFISGNAEKIDFPESLDLVVSASTFQWFEDFALFIKNLQKQLTKGAFLVFASFGKDNLKEIRQIAGTGLEYMCLDENKRILLENGFEILHSGEERLTLTFQTPVDVLRHLKNTGVNGYFSSVWTQSLLSSFVFSYEQQFACKGGVSLTYHPVYLVAKKI